MTSRGICQSVGVSLRKGEHFTFWTKNGAHKNKACFRSVLAGASGYASILDAATGKKTSGWGQKGLTGLRFSPQNESLVYTASSLDSVKLWDLRSGTDKPAKVFMDTSLADSGPEKGIPF